MACFLSLDGRLAFKLQTFSRRTGSTCIHFFVDLPILTDLRLSRKRKGRDALQISTFCVGGKEMSSERKTKETLHSLHSGVLQNFSPVTHAPSQSSPAKPTRFTILLKHHPPPSTATIVFPPQSCSRRSVFSVGASSSRPRMRPAASTRVTAPVQWVDIQSTEVTRLITTRCGHMSCRT